MLSNKRRQFAIIFQDRKQARAQETPSEIDLFDVL